MIALLVAIVAALAGVVVLLVWAACRDGARRERASETTDRGGHVRVLSGDDQADEWMRGHA